MGQRLGWIGLATASCTYITQAQFEEKQGSIDQDGDGASLGDKDCDDHDPARSPDLPETPYDGIDNDCGTDGDLVDIDGDGYPGISEADYLALQPEEPFPQALVGKAVDCADDPAQFADAAAIHPDAADAEVPYDGIDSDCDGGNDFDDDADGYLPDAALVGGAPIDVAAAFAAYVEAWGYEDRLVVWAPSGQAGPLAGDCNDFDGEVHPDPALPEVGYDGVDQDCDDRNDFDLDGDGYMPPALPDGGDIAIAYNDFVSLYHANQPPWTVPPDLTLPDGQVLGRFSDCLDAENPAIVANGESVPVDPATVYPRPDEVDDAWYDGVDTNCWADNDFDRDLDGFNPDQIVAGPQTVDIAPLYAAYVTLWGYDPATWGDPAPGDCDDRDPSTYPEALELVGDGHDQDCDGQTDAARFSFAGWVWDRPSLPRVSRVGDTYVMALTTRSIDLGGGSVLDEVGLALSVGLADAQTGAVPVAVQFKNADVTRPIDEVVDLAAVPTATDLSGDGVADPAAWFGTTFTADANGYTYLHGRLLYEHSGSGAIVVGSLVSNYTLQGYTPTSVDVAVNALGEPYVLGCADDVLHAIQGTAPQPTEPVLEDRTANLGGLCFLNTDPYPAAGDELVEYTRCTAAQCREYTLQRSTDLVTGGGSLTGETWTAADLHQDLQALVDGRSLVVRDLDAGADYPLFTNRDVSSGDAVLLGSVLFAAAIVDDGDGPEVKLTYGQFPVMDELALSFAADTVPDAVPYAVGLHVDSDRVLVVVTARDRIGTAGQDAVGWMFLGTP
ncbi:MAG: MopE-related protein [Myxococcota bacterium]